MNIEGNFWITLWCHWWRHHQEFFWHDLGQSSHMCSHVEPIADDNIWILIYKNANVSICRCAAVLTCSCRKNVNQLSTKPSHGIKTCLVEGFSSRVWIGPMCWHTHFAWWISKWCLYDLSANHNFVGYINWLQDEELNDVCSCMAAVLWKMAILSHYAALRRLLFSMQYATRVPRSLFLSLGVVLWLSIFSWGVIWELIFVTKNVCCNIHIPGYGSMERNSH